jgi:hypothetical protein
VNDGVGMTEWPAGPGDLDWGVTRSQAIPVAVDVGWTMGVLFGMSRHSFIKDWPPVVDRVSVEAELPLLDRKGLEVERVNHLLNRLGALFRGSPGPAADLAGPPQVYLGSSAEASADAAQQSDQEILAQANLAVIEWLARAGREFSMAYQLGRALRDAADPPVRLEGPRKEDDKQEIAARTRALVQQPDGNMKPEDQAEWEYAVRDALVKHLSRSRVSVIQELLSVLSNYLPVNSAAIVSVSIGWWSDLIRTIFDKDSPGGLLRFSGESELGVAGELTNSLLSQGDAWINLLVGAMSASGLLTNAGYARIINKTILRYFYMVLLVVAVLVSALYFINQEISGVGKVLAMIAAIASAIGVSAKEITNAIARFSVKAGQPLLDMLTIEAMAWTAATIPDGLKLNFSGVRALRRSGIPPSGPSGRR